MKSVELNAYPRTLSRRSGTKKIRKQGRIPAVIYGRDLPAQSLEVESKEIEHLIHHSVSETKLVDLSIQGDKPAKKLALLHQVQHHPLRGDVMHIDFRAVSENDPVVAVLPVETVGEAVGVKTGGGVLEHVLFKVRVRALPKNLPEFISVDVTDLDLGQTIHIGDIQIDEGVEILGDKNISVVSIAAPRQSKEAQAEAEAEAAAPVGEVEMTKEKKEQSKEGDKEAEKK